MTIIEYVIANYDEPTGAEAVIQRECPLWYGITAPEKCEDGCPKDGECERCWRQEFEDRMTDLPKDELDEDQDEDEDDDGLPVNCDDEPDEDYRSEGLMWGGLDV